jgi:LysR family transcriptional regulator, benzoate and cis,cis-muconate-responsive activator of ben and cat genes
MYIVSSRLELRHLRYFLAVARELHFGRAARRLGIAQPPLSQQIAALERVLGARLFDRNSKQVRLTAAGNALLDESVRILSLSERLPGVVDAATRGHTGVLSVGFSASASLGLVPPVFREFRRRFPAVRIVLREGTSVDHLSDVEAGVLDVAVIRGPIARPALAVETLRREPMMLALPADHPLTAKAKVEWSDLAEYDFVMFPRTAAPPLFDAIVAQCSRARFAPKIVHEATEWSTVSALIAAGAGLGFAPESVSRFPVEEITFRAVAGGTAIAEIIAASRRDNTSPALSAFIDIAGTLR